MYDKTEPDNVLEKDGFYFPESKEKAPHLIEQGELNNLVWEPDLSKEHAELLSLRLQQWNLLGTETKDNV